MVVGLPKLGTRKSFVMPRLLLTTLRKETLFHISYHNSQMATCPNILQWLGLLVSLKASYKFSSKKTLPHFVNKGILDSRANECWDKPPEPSKLEPLLP